MATDQHPTPTPPRSEAKGQTTANPGAAQTPAAVGPPSSVAGLPHTLLGMERDLRSWGDCPIPLTAVVSREGNEQGEY